MRPAAVPLSRPPERHCGGNLGGPELQPHPPVRTKAASYPQRSRAGIGLKGQDEEIEVKRMKGPRMDTVVENNILRRQLTTKRM